MSLSLARLPLRLGLWSLDRRRGAPRRLVGGQTVELALGGTVIESILGGMRGRAVAWRVAGLIVVGAVSAAILQTIGYATAPMLVG